MSNKTRLQTNNTNLQALIDKANALPDAGSASVETCTVTIGNYSNCPLEIIATTIKDGIETPCVMLRDAVREESSSQPYTISNVKCGSVITVIQNAADTDTPYVETDNGSTLIKACRVNYQAVPNMPNNFVLAFVFTAPTTAGVHSNIIADYEP